MIIEVRPFKIKVPNKLERAQRELDWFFHEGDSACGIKSNFDSFIRACKTSASHEETDAEDQLVSYIDNKYNKTFDNIMHGAGKYSTIDRRFRKLSYHAQRVLQTFYYEKQYDKSVEQFFGKGIELVRLSPSFSTLKSDVESLKKFICNKKKKKEILAQIKREVRDMYLSSLEEYARVI